MNPNKARQVTGLNSPTPSIQDHHSHNSKHNKSSHSSTKEAYTSSSRSRSRSRSRSKNKRKRRSRSKSNSHSRSGRRERSTTPRYRRSYDEASKQGNRGKSTSYNSSNPKPRQIKQLQRSTERSKANLSTNGKFQFQHINTSHNTNTSPQHNGHNNILNKILQDLRDENESLKKEKEIDKNLIQNLNSKVGELETERKTMKNMLEAANNRAAKAELEASNLKSQANEKGWRKLALCQQANIKAALQLNDEVLEEILDRDEENSNEMKSTLNLYTNSFYLKSDMRIPTKALTKWATDPNSKIIRKSHDRNYKYESKNSKNGGKRYLERVDDQEGKGDLIGDFDLSK